MFKIGDKVKCKNESSTLQLVAGKVYKITDVCRHYVKVDKPIDSDDWCLASRFELVEEKPQFDLKKNPWFIRTGTKEKSEAAQKWLFEQGVHWWHGMEIKDHGEKYLTNADSSGVTSSYILQGRLGAHASAQEIILEFEIVVKSVTYPVVETEQDKKIKELQQTIEKAQKQIEELKNMNS